MLETIQLVTTDGHATPARLATCNSELGIVLVQEIFGVNAHMQWLAQHYCSMGIQVVAPDFFARIQTGVQLDYSPEGFAKGREFVGQLGWDAPMRDVRAAWRALQERGARKIIVVGFCWGGVIAALSATRLGIASVGYYGARIPQFLHESPQAPLLLHFGQNDASIPKIACDQIAQAWPSALCYHYDAGHGFNRFGHPDYHAPSATLAQARTREFLELHA